MKGWCLFLLVILKKKETIEEYFHDTPSITVNKNLLVDLDTKGLGVCARRERKGGGGGAGRIQPSTTWNTLNEHCAHTDRWESLRGHLCEKSCLNRCDWSVCLKTVTWRNNRWVWSYSNLVIWFAFSNYGVWIQRYCHACLYWYIVHLFLWTSAILWKFRANVLNNPQIGCQWWLLLFT